MSHLTSVRAFALSLVFAAFGGATSAFATAAGDSVDFYNVQDNYNVSNANGAPWNLCIPESPDLPAGAVVAISTVSIASRNAAFTPNVRGGDANSITIKDLTGNTVRSDAVADFDGQFEVRQIGYPRLNYRFFSGAVVKLLVGEKYSVEFCQSDNSPMPGSGEYAGGVGVKMVQSDDPSSVLNIGDLAGWYPMYEVSGVVRSMPAATTISTASNDVSKLAWSPAIATDVDHEQCAVIDVTANSTLILDADLRFLAVTINIADGVALAIEGPGKISAEKISINGGTVDFSEASFSGKVFVDGVEKVAKPAAIWDKDDVGKGLNTQQGGFSIDLTNSKATINANGAIVLSSEASSHGGVIAFPSGTTKFSVLFKYSSFASPSGKNPYYPVFVAMRDNSSHEVGVLAQDNATEFMRYYMTLGTGTYTPTSGPTFGGASGYALFSSSITDGVIFGVGSSIAGIATAASPTYKYSGTMVTSLGIGGAPNAEHFDAWPNLVIEKVALFTNEFLSAENLSTFRFPVVLVSEINDTFGADSEITVTVPNGVTVSGDTTFNASTVHFVCEGSFTLKPPAGNTATLDFSRVTGGAVVSYSGAVPSVSGDTFTATSVPAWVNDGSRWTGTIAISDVRPASKNSLYPFHIEYFGNTNSTLSLKSIGSSTQQTTYLAGNESFGRLLLADDGNIPAFQLSDGLSNTNTTFRELAGSGTFAQIRAGILQGITINVMTNFTGTLAFNKMTVTFGTAKRAGRTSEQADTEYKSKLYIDPDAVLSVPAPFALWSPEAVVFNGPANFTTDATELEGLVLFSNVGQNFSRGDHASITINGAAPDWSRYRARLVGTDYVLEKRPRCVITFR